MSLIEIQPEVIYSSPYAGIGPLLNLICAIAAAQITQNRGYNWNYILGNFLFGLLCCGPVAVLSALSLKDMNAELQHKQMQALANRVNNAARERARESAVENVSQTRCPRCGSMNAAELVSCWNCGIDLVEADEGEPSTVEAQGPPEPAEGQAQPLKQHKLFIECRTCGKQFSGPKGKIQAIKACPKCGASPFDYRQFRPPT